jgi:hypothetical protein
MSNAFKRLLIGVVAVAVIAAMAVSAGAATIRISPGGSITATSLGQVTFAGSSINLRCNLTLRGTLATSASASVGTRIGDISRIEVLRCEGGTIRSINRLPYEHTFNGLVELAERSAGIATIWSGTNFTLSVTILGIVVDCTYSGNILPLIHLAGGRTELVGIAAHLVKTAESGSSCPRDLTAVTGTFELRPQQTVILA